MSELNLTSILPRPDWRRSRATIEINGAGWMRAFHTNPGFAIVKYSSPLIFCQGCFELVRKTPPCLSLALRMAGAFTEIANAKYRRTGSGKLPRLAAN